WHVHDAALGVHGDQAPDVDARAALPAVARPRVVVLLAGSGDRAEGPGQLSGVNVPRAHIAGGTERRILLGTPAGDDQMLVHRGRRAETIVAGQSLQNLRGVQADDATVAEGLVQLSSSGVKGEEPAVT